MDDNLYDVFGNNIEPEIDSAEDIDRPGMETSVMYEEEQFLLGLMSNPKLVRNVAFVGDAICGKTTCRDMLVEQTSHLSTFDQNSEKHMSCDTTTRIDGQARRICIKAVPMSLVLEASNSIFYLCNIMDTPGHADFCDEMTAALRLADGAVLIVDAAEGVRVSTEKAIRLAILDHIPIVVVINKVDRLITELKLPPEDAYRRIWDTIELINNHIGVFSPHHCDFKYKVIDPARGNVCFASASAGWSFTLESFAELISERQGVPVSADHLWGDYYYDSGTKSFKKEPPAIGAERSFVQFVLKPLYKMYRQLIGEDGKSLDATLKELDESLSTMDYRVNAPLLTLACSSVFGSTTGFTDMLFNHIPSPKVAAPSKSKHIYTGPKNSPIYKAMKNCDASGPLMVNVTKLYPKSDWSVFDAFGRVYSGEIMTGQAVCVLGECYSPQDKEDITKKVVTKLWVYQGRYRLPISKAPPGSWVLIEGVDASIIRTATLCNLKYDHDDVHICRPLQFNNIPVLRFSFSPSNPRDMHKMRKGLVKICKSYPSAFIKVEDCGEFIALVTGKLYLDCIMKDFMETYSEVEVSAVYRGVSLRETVDGSSSIDCFATSQNKMYKIIMTAEPMEKGIAEDIENGIAGKLQYGQEQNYIKAYHRHPPNWYFVLGNQALWAFGPQKHGPNILSVDMPSEVDDSLLYAVKDYIVEAFQWAAQEGPLCDEPMRNVKFDIKEAIIAPESLNRKDFQIIPTARRVVFSSFLTARPRLMEPIYYVEIQSPVAEKYKNLVRYRVALNGGHVIEEVLHPPAYILFKAFVPAIEWFDFERNLGILTRGQTFFHMVAFDHWDVVPGDPMSKTGINRARSYMVDLRRQKGMSANIKLDKFFDEAMIVELKQQRNALYQQMIY